MSYKIGLDFSPIYNHAVGGIPTFILNIVDNILKIDKENKYYQCYKISRIRKYKTLYPTTNKFKRIYYDKNFTFFLKKLDLFHGTAEWIPLKLKNVPKIITVHDLRGIEKNSFISKRYETKFKAIKYAADKVLVDSNFIKQEIINTIDGVEPERIEVIHLGYNEKFKYYENVKRKKIILFVGSISRNKNVLDLIQAFNLIKSDLKEYKLVCCGYSSDSEYFNDIKTVMTNNDLNDRINFIKSASDEELLKLYNKASMLILPSFYEGFGLPVLEAQACGCPVIISDKASLPEVGGESVLYCEPSNYNTISDAILEIYRNEKLRESLVKKGFENIKRFSWEQTAKKYINVYSQLL